MKKDRILVCVLKKEWFDKIKSGEKTHEYREVKDYWIKRIGLDKNGVEYKYRDTDGYLKTSMRPNIIHFTCGYCSVKEINKNLFFEITDINIIDGLNTDLNINNKVFDIKLGNRILM